MEVLFEYRGSRSELAVGSRENLTEVVSAELKRIGRSRAVVLTSDDSLPAPAGRRQNVPEVYLLQKWSALWDCYVDVRHCNDVKDGDRLAVITRPKPPSKLLQMFCCASDSSLPNGNKVGGSSKHRVPKGEEIQTVNYQFRVVWDQEDEAWLQDLEQDNANALQQQEDLTTTLGPGEQYVRGSSGVASWKIICKPEPKEDAGEESEGEEITANVELPSEVGAELVSTERLREGAVAGESESGDSSRLESGRAAGGASDLVGGGAGDLVGDVEGEDKDNRGEGGGRGEEGGGVAGRSSSPAVLEVTTEEVDVA